MNIDENKQYFYTKGGEKQDPVSGRELREMAASGKLNRLTDLVWTEGEKDWGAAGSCENLYPVASPAPTPVAEPISEPITGPTVKTDPSVPPAPAAAAPAPAPASPYAPPQAPAPAGYVGPVGAPSTVPLSRVNFGLYIAFSAISVALGIIGMIVIAVGAADTRSYGYYGYSVPNNDVMGAGMIIYLLSFIPWVVAVVLALVFLTKAWRLVQGLPGVKATPAEAVGFLFTPIFNIFYWMFVAWPGWVGDYNRFNQHNQDPHAPRVGAGAFITALVLLLVELPLTLFGTAAADGDPDALVVIAVFSIIIGILQVIFWWIGMAGLCRGTNYLVNQHNARLGVYR